MFSIYTVKGDHIEALKRYLEGKSKDNNNTKETITGEYYSNEGGLIYESIPSSMQNFFQKRNINTITEKFSFLRGKKRIGIDFTYSLNKDITLLALLFDKNTKDIIQEEVKRTIEEMQKYVETRKYDENGERTRTKGEAYIAAFEHHTSRNLDPQLHFHIFVANQVIRTEDKKLSSIEARKLIEHNHTLNIETNYRIMYRLQEQGYSAYLNGKNGDLRIIEDNELIDKFSSRKQQIIDKAKELFQTDDLEQLTREQIKQLVQMTRPRKANANIETLRDLWQAELEDIGYTQESFLNNAKQKQIPSSYLLAEDIEKAFDLTVALHDKTDGIAKRDHIYRNFLIKVSEIARENHKKLLTLEELQQHFEIHLNKLEKFQDQYDREYYATKEYIQIEQDTLALFKELATTQKRFFTQEDIQRKIKEYEDTKGFQLSEDQRTVLEKIDNTQAMIINGHAGAGKTTVAEVLKMLADEKKITVFGLAPTGKAGEELAKTFGKGDTVDSFLLKIQNSKDEKFLNSLQNSIILVDEAGMVSTRKMKELLEVAKTVNAKIILQGDFKQVKAVEAGDFLRDVYELAKQDTTIQKLAFAELTSIRRQKQEDYKNITMLYSNKNFNTVIDILIENKNKYFEKFDMQKIQNDFMKEAKDTLIVASTNKLKDEINQSIRDELQKQNMLQKNSIKINTMNMFEIRTIHDLQLGDIIKLGKNEYTVAGITEKGMKVLLYDPKTKRTMEANFSDIFMKQAKQHKEREFSVGDRIITTKNDKKLNVKNGELWHITNIDKQGNLTLENDTKKIKINANEYNYLDYAYAITVNKSQGMTVKNIMIADKYDNMNANLFYVALTRGKENFKIYTDNIVETLYKSQTEQVKRTAMSFQRNQTMNFVNRSTIAEKLISQDAPLYQEYIKYVDDRKAFFEKLKQNEEAKANMRLGKEPIKTTNSSSVNVRTKIQEYKEQQERRLQEKKEQEEKEKLKTKGDLAMLQKNRERLQKLLEEQKKKEEEQRKKEQEKQQEQQQQEQKKEQHQEEQEKKKQQQAELSL